MANIITELTARIEDYRSTNKNPCKNYATQAAAEKATAKMARLLRPTSTSKVGKTLRRLTMWCSTWKPGVAGWAALTCPSSCAAATRRADT